MTFRAGIFTRRQCGRLVSHASAVRPVRVSELEGRLQTLLFVPDLCRSPIVPVTYTVDHRRQQVHAVGSGPLSVADLTAYIAARVKDGVYDYDQLLDLSDAQLDVAPHEVIQVVKQARVHLTPKPIPFTAIVARPGGATFGLIRQLATLFDFEGATVHVAHSMEAANAWLDQMTSERRQGRAASEENR